MNNSIPFYKSRLPGLENRLAMLQRRLNRIALGRFLSFAAVVAALLFYGRLGVPWSVSSAVLMAVLFGLLVRKHVQLTWQRKYTEQLIAIHEREIEILSYRFEKEDPGKEFTDIHHPFSYDLDLFGEGSLFQFLNRTVMRKGREKLATWLQYPLPDSDVLQSRQEALKELAGRVDFMLDFRATGEITLDNTDDLEKIKAWFSEPHAFSGSRMLRMARIVFPLLSAACVILTIINWEYYRLLLLLFLVQLMITGIRLRATNRIHELLSRYLQTFTKTGRLMELVDREDFRSRHMASVKACFRASGEPAHKAIQRLAKVLTAFDTRFNVLAGFLLNGLLLWDMQCIWRLEKWKIRYSGHFMPWIDSLAEADALISLATFHFNFSDCHFPEFSEHGVIRAVSLGHPLIPDEQRVCNDFSIASEGTVVVITGANMAGKSTFLRSVGVNLVLAMTGSPVCAGQFSFSPVSLFTSMRTSDSLLHHESYFYAELKRIKTIIDELEGGRRMLIILDEILKGTNSADKHKGSLAVLERIFALGGTAIIATHDLELAKTEGQYNGRLVNKCFEIEINGAEVFFDYILREGITQKMNANLLMKQMGIVK